MCGRSTNSTSLPEPSGPIDERFVYRLTDEGKKALAECERSNGKPAASRARCTSEVAEALDSESRRESKRQRTKQARQRGARLGTVCGRWRDGRRQPELRMTGRWLEEAGFDLGRQYEVGVAAGKLTIQAL
jgi:Toxin SymE, type I toxin-antitoxin system